jgi:hypothetical protein
MTWLHTSTPRSSPAVVLRRLEMVKNTVFRQDANCRGGVGPLLVGVDKCKKVTHKTVDLHGSYFKFRL